MLKPTELANWLGVSTSTVRRWSTVYADYLSHSATGGDGRHRTYSDLDARILAYVGSLSRQGLTEEEIALSLNELRAQGWADLPTMPGRPSGGEPLRLVSEDAAETALATVKQQLMREISLKQERISELEEDLQRVRTEVQQERLAREEERSSWQQKVDGLQADLRESRETLGELRGRLSLLEAQERRSLAWLKWLLLAVVVLAVLAVMLAILSQAGG